MSSIEYKCIGCVYTHGAFSLTIPWQWAQVTHCKFNIVKQQLAFPCPGYAGDVRKTSKIITNPQCSDSNV